MELFFSFSIAKFTTDDSILDTEVKTTVYLLVSPKPCIVFVQ